MFLWLERNARVGAGVFGRLTWSDTAFGPRQYLCETLEDQPRHPRPWDATRAPVATWKVPGATCIPPGEYGIALTLSARFKTELPLVQDVPGFTGIRLHAGNVVEDTDGCILVGLTRSSGTTTPWLGRSREALARVLALFRGKPEPHRLLITETYTP